MEVETRPQSRTYPLKQPKNHTVPVPRWKLQLPPGVTHIHTLYIGVQQHGQTSSPTILSRAEESIQTWLDHKEDQPSATDTFRVTHGFDIVDSKVWVLYFTSLPAFHSRLASLDLKPRWRDLGDEGASIGLWCEHFTTPVERLETNYSSLHHRPGVAQIPGSEFPTHDLTGYWGSGRDRIPASAHEKFATPEESTEGPGESEVPVGLGEFLSGTNEYDHMCHIRSGQEWAQCPPAERSAYEDDLQKKLMTGMQYLWDHPVETGTLGLRFLQNVNPNSTSPSGGEEEEERLRETCGAGLFRNWADLEKWSSRHPSHLAIFNGAIAHAKRFGEAKKFMTWHEVSIFKKGEVGMEYVNCDPSTGVIKWVKLKREKL